MTTRTLWDDTTIAALGLGCWAIGGPWTAGGAPAGFEAADHLQRADDALQHVVEVVRDATGELADALESLCMTQCFFGLGPLEAGREQVGQ